MGEDPFGADSLDNSAMLLTAGVFTCFNNKVYLFVQALQQDMHKISSRNEDLCHEDIIVFSFQSRFMILQGS